MILSLAEVFLKLSKETTDWEVIFSSLADTEGHETNFALTRVAYQKARIIMKWYSYDFIKTITKLFRGDGVPNMFMLIKFQGKIILKIGLSLKQSLK